MIGLHLSHFRIDAELGRGGMGVVYRAFDTKLDRVVAIKVLPSKALTTEDDRARFFREAKAAASLHHSNIATVFGIDEAVPLDEDGTVAAGHTEPRLFIAMEYINGDTLRERIELGPLKLDDAVAIASQIAEALKAAHANDIVHRDIKSANVMLTAEGVAKVLDFGLAKTQASTMLTQLGSTLGTVAYMSPEQARGEEVDGRSDLYSLGTVLYEMIAGRLPFGGDYEQAILYSILNEDPEPLTAVRTGVSMELEGVVTKLLRKDASHRYPTAHGLLVDLKALVLPDHSLSRRPTAASAVVRPRRTPALIVGAGLAVGVVCFLLGYALRPEPVEPDRHPIRFSIDTGTIEPEAAPDISEDGRYIAITGQDTTTGTRGLYLYDVATEAWTRLTDAWGFEPRFSPSGETIVFRQNRSYYKTDVRGSTPVEFATDLSTFYGYTWLSETEIITQNRAGSLVTIDLSGQQSEVLVKADQSRGHTFLIPADLFLKPNQVLVSANRGTEDKADAVVYEVGKSDYTVLLEDADVPRLVGREHLVYLREEVNAFGGARRVYTQTFDGAGWPVGQLAIPIPPERGIDVSYTLSGHRVKTMTSPGETKWTWLELGTGESSASGLGAWRGASALSKDGRRFALASAQVGLEITGVETGARVRRSAAGMFNIVWSGDGQLLYYTDDDNVQMQVPVDGSEQPREVPGLSGLGVFAPDDPFRMGRIVDVSRDGRLAAVSAPMNGTWTSAVVDLADSTNSWTAPETSYNYPEALSPDARYLLARMARTEFGFPDGGTVLVLFRLADGARWLISDETEQAFAAAWSADGRSVYYDDRYTTTLRSRKIEIGTSITIGAPTVIRDVQGRVYDIYAHPDGERVLMRHEVLDPAGAQHRVEVVLNFDVYLEGIAPSGGR